MGNSVSKHRFEIEDFRRMEFLLYLGIKRNEYWMYARAF